MLNKLAYRILSRKKFLMKFLLPTNNPYVKGVSFTNDRHKEKKKNLTYIYSQNFECFLKYSHFLNAKQEGEKSLKDRYQLTHNAP